MDPQADSIPSLDKKIGHIFYCYAYIVYKYRWLFLLVPCCFAFVFALGFYFRPMRQRAYSVETFTPTDGASVYEKAVITGHWPLVQDRFIPGKFFSAKHWIQVVITGKNGSNILAPEMLNATEQFNQFVMNDLGVWSNWKNRTVTYRDLCLRWMSECYDNGHVTLFKQMKDLESYIRVAYPVARSIDTPLYLGTLLAGVECKNETGAFDYATHIRLSYNLKEWPSVVDSDSENWKRRLQEYISNEFQSPWISVGLWHGDSINEGLKENVDIVVPDFGVSYTVLTVFCTVTNMMVTWKNGKPRIDWVQSKPIVAFFGVFSSALAVVISMGFLLLVGVEYVLINAVMPILAISVGVSDMFIMVSAWWETDRNAPTDERLGQMLAHAGVAITITSITDVMSFIIGAWSSFPAVTSFCIYTALAMTIDYVCQITFFVAIMAFFGDFEAQGRHCYFLWKKVKLINEVSQPKETKVTVDKYAGAKNDNYELCTSGGNHIMTGNQNNGDLSKENHANSVSLEEKNSGDTLSSIFFMKYYRSIVFNPFVKVAICMLYFVYAGVAIWGCIVIHEGLRPTELVHRNHYVVRFYSLAKPFRDKGMQVHVVINNPKNLTLQSNRDYIMQMLEEFENGKHSLGSNATIFFLKEYLNYLNNLGAEIRDVDSLWTEDLKDWIRYTGGRPLWDTDIVWGDASNGESEDEIKAFRLQIGIRNFDTAAEQVETATFVRKVAKKYADLNVTTYHEFWPHVDQYIQVAPTTWRNLTISFITMIIIASVLIPNIYCSIFITLSMLSINMGVYGYMSHWGVSLDCISMITLIMSIGFAVDLTAHISYGYVCAEGTTAERASLSLQLLGMPVLLSALATLFGIIILSAAEVPLIVTFFKTVFLVMVLGLLHSHVFLPVALTIFLPDRAKIVHSAKLFHKFALPFKKMVSQRIWSTSNEAK